MICLGLPKHFPLILLSFAVCPFKSVCFPKSRAFTLLWGIFRQLPEIPSKVNTTAGIL